MHLMNQLPRLIQHRVAAINIEQLVALNGLLDRQHQLPFCQRAADGGEAARRNLLENGHHKTQ